MKKRIAILTVAALALITLIALISAVPIDGHDITFVSHTFDGTYSTWTYSVTCGDKPAISHWVMTWCNEAAIVEVSETPWKYGTDKQTGIKGIKFDKGYQDGESRIVWFKLLGDWPESDDVLVGIKAGRNVVYGNVKGPVCKALHPGIEVVKVCPDPTVYYVGETINYEWQISNTGNVPLSNIVLTDTGGPCTPAYVSGDDGDGILDVGEVWIYKCSYVVQKEDTKFTNTATVEGTDSVGTTVYDTSDTCKVEIAHPGIKVVKVCPDPTVYYVGESINYEWQVSSTGDVSLQTIVLTDTGGPCTPAYVSGDDGDGILDVGEVWIYKCSYVVQEGDTGFTNRATVKGTDSVGTTVYDTSDTCVVTIVDPGIKVVKTATFYPSCPGACLWGRDPLTVEIGDTVMYCYMVTNMADVTLTDVTVTDDLYGEVTLGKTTLAPGESTWGTLTHVVTESDVPTVTNIATAAGTDPRGRTVTATDDCTINVEIAPDITVDKTASLDGTCLGSDSLLVKIGDTVTYCYVVTNTGDVTLTGVTVTDDLYGEVTLGKITLEPGESTWGTLTHVVTESDFGDPCFPLSLVNTATVTGTDPLGETVTDTDVAKVSLRSW